jgi:integrase
MGRRSIALDPETVEVLKAQAARQLRGRQPLLQAGGQGSQAARDPPARLATGIHPKVVSERLGHATVSITLDTYSHAIPAMQEEAAALIAGLVFAAD